MFRKTNDIHENILDLEISSSSAHHGGQEQQWLWFTAHGGDKDHLKKKRWLSGCCSLPENSSDFSES